MILGSLSTEMKIKKLTLIMQITDVVVSTRKLIKATNPGILGPFPNSVGLNVFKGFIFFLALGTRI